MTTMHVTICVMIGLPATGKTTLVKLLKDFISTEDMNMHICIASYDLLMPQHINFESEDYLANVPGVAHNSWKSHRDKIFNIIRNKLLYIINLESHPYHTDSTLSGTWEGEPVNKDAMDINSHIQFCDCFAQLKPIPSNINHIVLIDDNMFYRSMRYIYFQLARELACSYCQIYMESTAHDAIARNSKRSIKIVTEQTIMKMAGLLEDPDKLQNHWEMQTFHIDSKNYFNEQANAFSQQTLKAVYKFLVDCSRQVVDQVVSEADLIAQQLDRKKCLENFVYQCDQVLRKYISVTMKACKINGRSKNELKLRGKILNDQRKSFLTTLRNQEKSIDFQTRDFTEEWKQNIIGLFTRFLSSTES